MSLLNSGTWKRITAQLASDRADLVEQLIKNADQRETDNLRGKIQQLDDIIETYPERLKNTD